MKLNGQITFSSFLIFIAAYVIYSAAHWSFKTGFFPLAVAIPLLLLSAAHLCLEVFGAREKTSGPAVEAEFSHQVPPEIARRRVIAIFSWIAAFIAFVFLLGFPLAVPLFMFFYLKFQSQVSWLRTVGLTAATWVCFHVLFQRVVQLQFEEGVIQTWLVL
jgi:hypothetical protein